MPNKLYIFISLAAETPILFFSMADKLYIFISFPARAPVSFFDDQQALYFIYLATTAFVLFY